MIFIMTRKKKINTLIIHGLSKVKKICVMGMQNIPQFLITKFATKSPQICPKNV